MTEIAPVTRLGVELCTCVTRDPVWGKVVAMRIYYCKEPYNEWTDVPVPKWPRDYDLVAEIDQSGLVEHEALEKAFRKTQNHGGNWTKHEGVKAFRPNAARCIRAMWLPWMTESSTAVRQADGAISRLCGPRKCAEVSRCAPDPRPPGWTLALFIAVGVNKPRSEITLLTG